MITEILPPEVAAQEAFEDMLDVMLFPEEESVIARAAGKRRREFTTGRACARAALAKLGMPPVPIVPGPHGAPCWPPGVVGSITHCPGYRASAVAFDRDMLTIGLDAEPHQKLPDGVLEAISAAGERARLAALAEIAPDIYWDRLLFSAKESVYKAWFPLTLRWLGFEDAVISLDPVNGTFSTQLLVNAPSAQTGMLPGFAGRWLVRDGLVATTIVVPS
ncbi:MAG: 4'-phosphopantetheinyl transferase family protein [Streptosporangiaceae bacterium]